ncbi:MAG: CusA/CzcA family heavy metal efflux RND transporter [Bacteroidia bacterium]|nr:CusA/CzcA family heavy metal efflux RND transporter [Bacteroidia bacterium]
MIDNIIAYSIRNKFIIGLLVLGLIGWGLYSLRQLPIDAVPDITNNQVQLITQTPTLAAQEVEQFITYPVELAMQNLPGVVEIRSISRFGLSVVTVVFREDMGTYLPRQLVSEQLKVAEAEIPPGLGSPEMSPISTGLGEIYQYALHVKPGYDSLYSPMELRSIQDWIVRRQLSGVDGVVEVNSFGGFLKQYEVAVNPEQLRAMNVTMAEVYQAVEKNNQNTGGSYIEKGPNAYFVRGEGLVRSLKDIEKIPVKTVENIPVRISDVAKVQFGHSPRYGAMTSNGEGETVGGIVMMLKGANSAEVIERVQARIEQIQQSLPEGITIDPFIDRSKLVNKTIKTVSTNLIEGGLIVVFILVLLLGNLRAGLVVASVIPLAMLFAIAMMNVFGVSANLMSLGAIDFGLIVDGAVIIVESIVHRLYTQHKNQVLTQAEMDKSVRTSAIKIRNSAAFGEIIILIVYLPILALVGIEGKMFAPMAQTVSFAILGAFILSLTYVPMMSALALSKKIEVKRTIADRIIEVLQRIYDPAIRFSLRFRSLVIGVAIILFGLSLWRFSNMGGEFIPRLEEGDLAINATIKTGSSLSQTIETMNRLEGILMKFPEVEEIVTRIGAAEIPTDPMPIEAGDLIIVLKDKDEWTTTGSQEELVEKMKEAMAVIPGVNFEFSQPIELRFNELMTGVRSDIAIKIYGEDLQLLYQKGQEANAAIQVIDGVGDTKLEQIVGLPQMQVQYDRDKIAQYGLNIEDLNTLVRTAFAGEVAGVVFEGEKRFDLVVRLEKAFRQDIQNLRELYLTLPNGNSVPLNEIASIEYQNAPMQISRDDTKRRIVLGVNARGRDVESLVGEIEQTLQEKVDLPPGYYITYGGQFENLQEAKARLSVAVPVALLLIFTLLYLTFHSLGQALLIFTAIPLSAIGGIWALTLRGMPFSISAGVGFIALFGVAVLNGIVLIGYFNDLKKEGVNDVRERILEGTRVRLRPVIMTAAVASLGFLPMALSTSEGAEVQKPLATVVIGGLITATLLTLLVLPVLYRIFFDENRSKAQPSASGIILKGLFVLCLSIPLTSMAQRPLSAEEAVQLALDKHPSIQTAVLGVERQQALQKSAFDLPATSLSYGRGQFNTAALDNQWQLSQRFSLPQVYQRNGDLLKAKTDLAERAKDISENQLRREVRLAYQTWHFWLEQRNQYDSLLVYYQDFLEAADLRFQTGESNQVESQLAKAKFQQIQLDYQQVLSQIAMSHRTLQQWLSTTDSLMVPLNTVYSSFPLPGGAASNIGGNPDLIFVEQQIMVAEKSQKVAQAQLLPQFSAGYFRQQIDGASGFQGWQVGISVPLWLRAKKAESQAHAIERKVIASQAEDTRLRLSSAWDQLHRQYQTARQQLTFYETEGLKLAEDLVQSGTLAYRAGEIDYVAYIQNLDQAFALRISYLESIRKTNQAVIGLSYLLGI